MTVTVNSGTLAKLATLVAGVLGVVLPQLSTFGLPTSTANVITVVGGALLAALAVLEHPTTKVAASNLGPTTNVTTAPIKPPVVVTTVPPTTGV